jgi:methylated-DNA-[protein]-cysteine S-methyltransferase
MSAVWYDDLPTPIGQLRLVADEQGLCQVWFETGRHQREPESAWARSRQALAFAREQLEEYFAGTRQVFDLPLHPRGTPFQLAVWQELARIPYGATISYGELARRIGQPQAVRAVGAAN